MNDAARLLLSDIRSALGTDHGDGRREGQDIGPPPVDRGRPGNGLEAAFLDTLRGLGGDGVVCRDGGEVRSTLRRIFDEGAVQEAVRWDIPELDAIFGPPSESEDRWGRWVRVSAAPRAERVEVVARADVGIIWADRAIAETGGLVHRCGGARHKSVSLLPPTLVALLRSNSVVHVMGDMGADISAWLKVPGESQGLQFISRPSRSSDIENDLTIGVHGPGRVYAVILDGIEI